MVFQEKLLSVNVRIECPDSIPLVALTKLRLPMLYILVTYFLLKPVDSGTIDLTLRHSTNADI